MAWNTMAGEALCGGMEQDGGAARANAAAVLASSAARARECYGVGSAALWRRHWRGEVSAGTAEQDGGARGGGSANAAQARA